MEVHEKLRHLSEDQVEEVINLYLDNSYKLDDITNRYRIDINPRNLVSILQPIKTNDFCEYCNVKLVQYIKNRKYTRDNLDNSTCPKCGHVYVRGLYSTEVCNCSNCKNKKKEFLGLLSKKIKEVYTLKIDKHKFDNLSLSEKFTLFNLMKSNRYKSHQHLFPLFDQVIDYIDPPDYIIDDYNNLLSKDIIIVSPSNEIDAFDQDDFPYSINVAKAKFDINVDFTEINLMEIKAGTYFKNLDYDDDELINLWKDLLYWDAIEYYKTMLNNRQLDLFYKSKKDPRFEEMVSEIGHTQVLYKCKRAAKNLADLCIQNEKSTDNANNNALSYINNYYRYGIKNDWANCHLQDYIIGDRLECFIEFVLDKTRLILKYPPSLNVLKEQIENQDSEA